ncbi:MAG TPA: class I SAM-dependent methyltransferase [Pyrinomonadaceae bacterium]|nr:class I SAM-dependent methyltransferase [Pyrinomonadaceae bacterium]
MADLASNTYDEVSYPGRAQDQTHPDRLATIATLFGMSPAPVERCRVLELACGDGSNIVPMALCLPESEFAGIDLAAHPIKKGRRLVEALGLKNITLHQLDLMDFSADFGRFDYIIAHGLYSWVPPAVQDKVLLICKSRLNPHGVAYISYNTYPGGHLRKMLREMMLYHIRDLTTAQDRINQARALAKWLTNSPSDVYQIYVKRELERIMQHGAGYVYHDDLAGINAPAYFHQFISHAARHDLQFLSEADFSEMQYETYPPEVAEQLRLLADQDVLAKEQYLDFLKCRSFRQTLLCHRNVSLDRSLKPERINTLYVASHVRPVSPEFDIRSREAEEFRGPKEGVVSTSYPLAKAALSHLGEIYPQSLRFDELVADARSRLGLNSGRDGDALGEGAPTLAEILLKIYEVGLVELHQHKPRFVLEAGERPVASPLARLQAADQEIVTTLHHSNVKMEGELGRQLLLLLDGTRDRAALLRELGPLMESAVESQARDGARSESDAPSKTLFEELEKQLNKLARLGLLAA